jgi:L-lysine 6-transaminase
MEAVQRVEEQAVQEIKQALHDHPDDIAAIIIEPIQGEGGDNHFRTEFMETLRIIADENEVILIYDEVQSGVGLTGKMWAHEHFGPEARPDIISFGKKTQVCGIFVSQRVDEVENNVFHESSRLNSTWGGNLTDMVRFTLYLDIIKKEALVERAAQSGEVLMQGLHALANEFADLVSNVRGRGLMAAFDLPTTEQRDRLLTLIQEEGALILGCGHKTVRFRPHLNITHEEIALGMEIITRALKRL